MKNLFSFRAQRNGVILFVFVMTALFFFGSASYAQTPSFYWGGSNTGGNAIPFNPNGSMTSFSKWQGFYPAGNFPGAYAGNISKVYFRQYPSAAGLLTTYTNARVSLGQTTTTTFSTSAWFTPVTQALYSTALTIPACSAGAWFSIQLQTPFYYDPSKSLVIEFCSDGASSAGFTIATGAGTGQNIDRIYGGSGCNGSVAGSNLGTKTDFGFDLTSPYNNDAGISALLSPVNFCSGTYDLQVSLMNYGLQNLNVCTINWKYDNVLQTPQTWTGVLAPLATTPITLGTRTFSSGTPHTLQVWTTSPNNQVDSGKANDTLTRTLQPALNGTYTIGGSSPDFTTFAAATSALQNYGVCGPVVFNVRAGTYTECVTIPDVSGASIGNTITFQSESGVNTSVIINWNGASTGTINLTGAKYITIQNMTIRALYTSTCYGINITGTAAHNKILNNIIYNANINTTVGYGIYAYSGTYPDHLIQGNTIQNGYMGMYLYGGSTASLLSQWVIDNNTLQNVYCYQMYIYYSDAIQITNNNISTPSTYTVYGMYLYYPYNQFLVSGNKWAITGASGSHYGAMVYYPQTSAGLEGKFMNNFLFVNGATAYGLYDYYGLNMKYYNNTVYTTSASGYTLYCYHTTGHITYFVNNILYNAGGGYAAYVYNATSPYWDYNVLYSSGSILGYIYPSGVTVPDFATWLLQVPATWDRHSISKTIQFADIVNGDLHLAGTSQNDMSLVGIGLPEVTTDIDGDPRVLPYRGADEACYILPGSLTQNFIDKNGNTLLYAEVPGSVNYQYGISFPTNLNFAATITLQFINVASGQTLWTYQFTVNKLAGVPLTGVQSITLPSNLPVGAYKINAIYNTMNSCSFLINYNAGLLSLLTVPQGQTPCTVWPGDANNDGVCNYVDQKTVNSYILNAGLKPTWLNGPARYNVAWEGQPQLYLTWIGQMCAPWATADGCYIDTDGNGQINNFDYLAMKVNWMRTHGPKPAPKSNPLTPDSFDMTQNYPNPFNPITTLMVAAPEPSDVRLVVTDMLGREVATLVNGRLESGVHPVVFDASHLSSGSYLATITMTGTESSLTFSKTVRMTLSK